MKRLIMASLGYILLCATVAYCVAFVLAEINGQDVWLYTNIGVKEIQYGSYTARFYIFDIKQYLQDLQYNTSILQNIKWPTFPTIWTPTDWNPINILKGLYNIIIWFINIMIWLVNIFYVLPTKLLTQPILYMFTILGINNEKLGLYQIVRFLYSLNIQLLKYWA